MATAAPPKLLTAEEFMKLDLGEGMHELVRGEIVDVPPPMPEPGVIVGNITGLLFQYGRQSGHGYVLAGDSPVVTKRNPDTVRGADVCFYSYARWPRESVGTKLPPIAPDVVVEVFSPGNRPGETQVKVSEYLFAGVPLVLLVYPKTKQVGVYRPDEPFPRVLEETDLLENLPELPGFSLRVGEFFA
jgi:Uma2 family endonuclease